MNAQRKHKHPFTDASVIRPQGLQVALVDSKMDVPMIGLTARDSGSILNRDLPANPSCFVELAGQVTDDIVQFCIRVNPQAEREFAGAKCRGIGGGQLQEIAATIECGRGSGNSSWPRCAPIDTDNPQVPLVARGIAPVTS